jgi:hypothetical protein
VAATYGALESTVHLDARCVHTYYTTETQEIRRWCQSSHHAGNQA